MDRRRQRWSSHSAQSGDDRDIRCEGSAGMTDVAEMLSLRDQVAVVAGGYGGIGEAVCRAFATLGARVAVAGSKETAANGLASAIDPSGERTLGIGFDARDVGSVQRMTEAVSGR